MLGTLISAAVPIIGGLLGSNANKQAAQQASNAAQEAAQIQADAQLRAAQMQIDANKEARQEYRQGADRGIAAIRAGTGRYAETISPLLTPNPVGLRTYRGLTDAQQIGRDDLIRQGRATLAASGLRGAGRAGVAAIMDQDRRYIANAVDQNDAENRQEQRRAQGSADSARRGLAQVYAQEGGAIANTEIGASNQIGQSITNDGRAVGTAAANAGNAQGSAIQNSGIYSAGATTANGQLWGDAIGALGSVIADQTKYRPSNGSI